MKTHSFLKRISAFCALAFCAAASPAHAALRPPAVPLVTFDPYLSVWSEADHLTDDVTRHWTHRPHPLTSLIRIDGKAYRLMGKDPATVDALPQTNLVVTPTRSIYDFEGNGVHVTMTFMTPALPDDLDALALPLTYLTWQVRATDGKPHGVSIYDGTSALLTVNTPDEQVKWGRAPMGALTALRAGTAEQHVLGMSGDDTRINWGYVYAVAPTDQAVGTVSSATQLQDGFTRTGRLPAGDDAAMPRAANADEPTLGLVFNVGNVGAAPKSVHAMIGYDETYAIKYFGKNLRPYWNRNNIGTAALFQNAERDYPKLMARCAAFDSELMADMSKVGGPRYAQICALAYRQCLAANGLAADAKGQPLYFTKENTSNGDIATVDVIFPESPQLLFLSPALMKASLVSNLEYAASSHWKFPNAPHDLGTYPTVTGRDDGGEGMPVEESGNMILICDAIAQIEGNANFVAKWWPQLTQWEHYLEKYGNDPEDQLCTDDFMGHLAHNANLSVKAILAIAAYGDMAKMRGDKATATRIQNLARTFAQHWAAVADAGDRSLLAFDKPDTWSQKYNLVWDKLLNLNVFPPSVAQREVDYYKKVMQPYGVPLDSRTKLTKTDWTVWSATLASNPADFQTMISPIYDYANTTTSRQPFADSYVTTDIASSGMHARPVIGGVFIKMMSDRAIWKKWAMRGDQNVGPWAALPPPPVVHEVLAPSGRAGLEWRYTLDKPADDWAQPNFDDSGWKSAPGAFGTNPPGLPTKTNWNSDDIWMRRTITVPNGDLSHLQLWVYHDEDVEIYTNGILAGKEGGFTTTFSPISIAPAARALFKPGAKILLAVHCHQTGGGQGVDVGLANVIEPKE